MSKGRDGEGYIWQESLRLASHSMLNYCGLSAGCPPQAAASKHRSRLMHPITQPAILLHVTAHIARGHCA